MFTAPLIEEIGSQFLYTELHQFMASFYWFSCPKQDSRISIFCPITFYFIPSQNCKEVPFIVFCTLLAWRSYYVQWSHFSFNLDKHGGSEQYIHSEMFEKDFFSEIFSPNRRNCASKPPKQFLRDFFSKKYFWEFFSPKKLRGL